MHSISETKKEPIDGEPKKPMPMLRINSKSIGVSSPSVLIAIINFISVLQCVSLWGPLFLWNPLFFVVREARQQVRIQRPQRMRDPAADQPRGSSQNTQRCQKHRYKQTEPETKKHTAKQDTNRHKPPTQTPTNRSTQEGFRFSFFYPFKTSNFLLTFESNSR